MSSTLINDPRIRGVRIEMKRHAVQAWLSVHTWSTAEVLGQVMGITSRQAVHQTLAAMIRDGLMRRAEIQTSYGPARLVFGFTPHGAAMAVTPGVSPAKSLEPSKIKVTTMEHELDIQRLHLRAQRAGWKDWQLGGAEFSRSEAKYADAIGVRQDGQKVAIEVERNVKTIKRYAEIFVAHLAARKDNKWEWIYYLSPNAAIRDRVRGVFAAIHRATWHGQVIEITDAHRAPFQFFAYSDDWTT